MILESQDTLQKKKNINAVFYLIQKCFFCLFLPVKLSFLKETVNYKNKYKFLKISIFPFNCHFYKLRVRIK